MKNQFDANFFAFFERIHDGFKAFGLFFES